MTELRKVKLATGVTLNIALAGHEAAPAVILLHGFPESHRTWRGIVPLLEDRFRLVMPDQRGFAESDHPQNPADYHSDMLIDDIFALADALGIGSFALAGHDWGGAIAWPAALRGDPRLTRLIIVNAPHPVIFQKSLIEDEDQRAASQYINVLKAPGFEKVFEARGYEWLFERTFGRQFERGLIDEAEKQTYLADWSRPGAMNAMLNWYRAGRMVVPPPGATIPIPEWALRAFPKVEVPTLVVWGLDDTALLPVQLDGLGRLVEDLTIVRIAGVGHFVTWEAPDQVAAAVAPFLMGEAVATAAAQ